MFSRVAGCSHMFVFIAGARMTRPVKAKYMVVRKSSAMPWANFASRSAVAGATTRASLSWATWMCSTALERVSSPPVCAAKRLVTTLRPVRAAKVSGRTNSCAARVITTCTAKPRCSSNRANSAAL